VKKRIHAAHTAKFAVAREKRAELARDDAHVEAVLEEGGRRARAVACDVMNDVRDAAGLPRLRIA
jgi:hypothetical protein